MSNLDGKSTGITVGGGRHKGAGILEDDTILVRSKIVYISKCSYCVVNYVISFIIFSLVYTKTYVIA